MANGKRPVIFLGRLNGRITREKVMLALIVALVAYGNYIILT